MRGGHTTEVVDVSSSPQAGLFATVGRDETAKIWRSTDYALIRTIPNSDIGARCVALSKDGQFIAVGGGNGFSVTKLYRVSDGVLLHTLTGIQSAQTGDVAFSPDNTYLATVANGGPEFKLWRISDGALVRTGTTPTNYGVGSVAFSPDGSLIALHSDTAKTAVFSASSGVFVRIMNGDSLGAFSFSPNGNFLASGAVVFNVSDRSVRTIAPTIENTTSSFSPDGSLFAVGQSAGTAKVLQVSASPNWNLVSQFQSGSLFAHIAFLSNSNLAIGNSNVNVWDANTGTLIRNVGDIRNKITALAFSADGQTLVTAHLAREAADESIQLRNVIDGTLAIFLFHKVLV